MKWDHAGGRCWRYVYTDGRIGGRVTAFFGSTEYVAEWEGKNLGSYISAESAKQAVEAALSYADLGKTHETYQDLPGPCPDCFNGVCNCPDCNGVCKVCGGTGIW
jgi:hypothetical protein